jgi:hypothetical protein
MYYQRLFTCFGTPEAIRRVVRLAMGDSLFFLLVVQPVLDIALGTANGFTLRLVDPGTAKRCAAVKMADDPSNDRHVKSIVKGCLSGLILFNHVLEHIYEVWTRPLKNVRFCSRPRLAKILTTDIHSVFRGLTRQSSVAG